MEVVEQKPQRQEQLQQAEEEGTGMSDPLYTDLDLPAADVQTNEVSAGGDSERCRCARL